MRKFILLFTFFIIFNMVISNSTNPNGYYKDEKNVYYKNKIIKNADLETFRIFGSDYAKDINHVYLYGKIFKKADPETFTISKCPHQTNIKMYDSYYAEDKNNMYYMNKIVKKYIPQCGIGFSKLDFSRFEWNSPKKFTQS